MYVYTEGRTDLPAEGVLGGAGEVLIDGGERVRDVLEAVHELVL